LFGSAATASLDDGSELICEFEAEQRQADVDARDERDRERA
jgi:hypothetical protein